MKISKILIVVFIVYSTADRMSICLKIPEGCIGALHRTKKSKAVYKKKDLGKYRTCLYLKGTNKCDIHQLPE